MYNSACVSVAGLLHQGIQIYIQYSTLFMFSIFLGMREMGEGGREGRVCIVLHVQLHVCAWLHYYFLQTPVGLQSSIKHKQPLLLPTKSIEDVEVIFFA